MYKRGIYKIENTKTCEVYIGASENISVRFDSHRSLLRQRRHSSRELQEAWDNNCILFERIRECRDENIFVVESSYISRESRNGAKLINKYNTCGYSRISP